MCKNGTGTRSTQLEPAACVAEAGLLCSQLGMVCQCGRYRSFFISSGMCTFLALEPLILEYF